MLPMIFLYIVIVINGTLIRRYGNVEMVASKNINIHQPSPATHVFGFSGPSYYGADAYYSRYPHSHSMLSKFLR